MQKSEIALLQEMRNALARAVDGVTFAQVAIDYDHHKIHEESSFVAHYESAAGSLPTAIGEETAIGFITPAAGGVKVHLIVDVQADQLSTYEIREDPTIVVDQGTALAPFNRFRGSANIPGVLNNRTNPVAGRVSTYTVIQANAADLSIGTGNVLHTETIGASGTPNSFTAGVTRGQREFVLKAATEYVVILTNLTAEDTIHHIELNWYEHTPKNA